LRVAMAVDVTTDFGGNNANGVAVVEFTLKADLVMVTQNGSGFDQVG
jgi:hypothetical protein